MYCPFYVFLLFSSSKVGALSLNTLYIALDCFSLNTMCPQKSAQKKIVERTSAFDEKPILSGPVKFSFFNTFIHSF